MPMEKHIKPYMFFKLRIKCFLNITILMWFTFGIFKKMVLCFVLLLSDAEPTATKKQPLPPFLAK